LATTPWYDELVQIVKRNLVGESGKCFAVFTFEYVFAYCVYVYMYVCDRGRERIRRMCNYENNQQDALYRLIYYSKPALHVSGGVSDNSRQQLG
jgi:uncharacterized protein involved in copper resistance